MGIEKRAAVKVLNSSMVVPEVETPRHGLWLSNLDLAVAQDFTNNFTVYRSEGGTSFCREKLKTSLSKALVPFYPLAGRLVEGQDGRLEVSCNGEGVLFVEAEMDCTIDEFGDFIPSAEITKMLVPSPPSGDLPCVLLLLQITSFRCGGVTLGVSVHHTVVDGLSALHFIFTWAGIARGADNLLPPFLDRSLLRARSPPMVLAENPACALHYNTQEPPHAAAKPFCTGIFLLSQDQLAALKMSGAAAVPLSTFKVVASHVWRCMCKARGLAEDQETRLHIAVDARNRLDPPLPKGFFGNAVFRMYLTARAGDVMSQPLGRTASRIHEETSRIGDEHVRSLVDFLELQPLQDLKNLEGPLKNVRATDVGAISWLGLPLYEADFGWGKPVLMRRAALPCSGMAYMMHHPGKEGGISLVVTLETECMPEFEKTFYHGFSGILREP